MELEKKTRLTGGLVSVVAAATSTEVYILSTGKTCVIKKIRAYNNTGGTVTLTVGYLTNASTPVFTQVMPTLTLLQGENNWIEDDLPICGNTNEGFHNDNTTNTGTDGSIYVQVSASAASPNDVQIQVEVEEE